MWWGVVLVCYGFGMFVCDGRHSVDFGYFGRLSVVVIHVSA